MQDRPTERVRVLLDGLTASAIVDRVHPYYSGYQFEGEWLDTLKESIDGELDDLDRTIRGRAGTVGAVDRLREYVANAPASSMGEMARAIVRNYCDAIDVEAGDPTGARRFAERLEAAAAECADVTLFGTDYTALPVDADGEPIHVGDVMEERSGHTFEVASLMAFGGSDNWLVLSDPRNFSSFREPHDIRHHHAPTVEDVLREFVERLDEIGSEDDCVGEAEQECRACIRRDIAAAYAEYAAKLRLAGEE